MLRPGLFFLLPPSFQGYWVIFLKSFISWIISEDWLTYSYPRKWPYKIIQKSTSSSKTQMPSVIFYAFLCFSMFFLCFSMFFLCFSMFFLRLFYVFIILIEYISKPRSGYLQLDDMHSVISVCLLLFNKFPALFALFTTTFRTRPLRSLVHNPFFARKNQIQKMCWILIQLFLY